VVLTKLIKVEVTERLELWEIAVEGVDFGGADVAHKKCCVVRAEAGPGSTARRFRDEDVRRLDIAMDDAAGVR